jgi:hypothetical protein
MAIGGRFDTSPVTFADAHEDALAMAVGVRAPIAAAKVRPGEMALLIRLERGFVMRIEAERDALTGGTGHRIPRTAVIRMLLKEALDARERGRNGQVPVAVAVASLDAPEAASAAAEAEDDQVDEDEDDEDEDEDEDADEDADEDDEDDEDESDEDETDETKSAETKSAET